MSLVQRRLPHPTKARAVPGLRPPPRRNPCLRLAGPSERRAPNPPRDAWQWSLSLGPATRQLSILEIAAQDEIAARDEWPRKAQLLGSLARLAIACYILRLKALKPRPLNRV